MAFTSRLSSSLDLTLTTNRLSTLQLISRDLSIPLKNISFIPQNKFHIDMELFVAPCGDVVVVDETIYEESLIRALKSIDCKVRELQN